MKQLFFIFIFALISCKGFAQVNLVPNWSFEDTISCPQNQGFTFYSYVPPWFSTNKGTPDIFNSCNSDLNGVPYNCNGYGYQPANTGSGYAGFNFIWSANSKEYLSAKLISPLIKDRKYCISFYVNLDNGSYLGVDAIGAYLSTDSIYYNFYTTIHVQPQIENPYGNVVMDTLNWTLISGEYTAIGGEQYITIGDFKDDSLNIVDTIPTGIGAAYYYLDDVSVYDCGDDTTGIKEIVQDENDFRVFPNPANDKIEIVFPGRSAIEILNIEGRVLTNQIIKEGHAGIDISELGRGMYFIRVTNENGIVVRKFVKE